MSAARYPAHRFDGRSAEAMPVVVCIAGGALVVETADGVERERQRLDRCMVSEPFAHAPRLIAMPGGVSLEVPDPEQRLLREIASAGMDFPLSVRLQAWWPAAVVALGLLCALSGLIYFKWLPAAVRWLAFALPAHLELRMGKQILNVLDGHYFEPTRLPAAQRARIAERFGRLAALAAPDVDYRLEFRFGGDDVINAMALPGGTIVLLDDLVTYVADDDRVLAVLGHELGHVVHKHSARQVLQSVGLGALAGLLWGDFSGVAASVPVALWLLNYSRDFERDADAFAVASLRAQGLSSRPLYEFFEQMQVYEGEKGKSDVPEFLSSHPSTEERRLRLLDTLDGEGRSRYLPRAVDERERRERLLEALGGGDDGG